MVSQNSSRVLRSIVVCTIILIMMLSSCLEIFATSEEVSIGPAPAGWTGKLTPYDSNSPYVLHWGNFLDEIYNHFAEYRDYSLLEYKYYYIFASQQPLTGNDGLLINVYLSNEKIFNFEELQKYYDVYGQNDNENGSYVGEEYPAHEVVNYLNTDKIFAFQFFLYQYWSYNQNSLVYDCRSNGYVAPQDPSSAANYNVGRELLNLINRMPIRSYVTGQNNVLLINSHQNITTGLLPTKPAYYSTASVFGVRNSSSQYTFYSSFITNDNTTGNYLLNDYDQQTYTFMESPIYVYLATYTPVRMFAIGKDSVAWAKYYYKFYNPTEDEGSYIRNAIETILENMETPENGPTREFLESVLDQPQVDQINDQILDGKVAALSMTERYRVDEVNDLFIWVWNTLNSNAWIASIIVIAFAMLVLSALLQRS